MRSVAKRVLAFLLLGGIAAGTASAASREGDTKRSLFDQGETRGDGSGFVFRSFALFVCLVLDGSGGWKRKSAGKGFALLLGHIRERQLALLGPFVHLLFCGSLLLDRKSVV